MSMKKFFSAILAASMFLGAAPIMAADGSSTPSDVNTRNTQAPAASATVDDKDVTVTPSDLASNVADQVKDDADLLALFADAGFDFPANASFMVYGGDYAIDANGPADVTFDLNKTGFKPGDEVYVMEYDAKAANPWKIVKATVGADDMVTVSVDGATSVVFAGVKAAAPAEKPAEPSAPAKPAQKPAQPAASNAETKAPAKSTAAKTVSTTKTTSPATGI